MLTNKADLAELQTNMKANNGQPKGTTHKRQTTCTYEKSRLLVCGGGEQQQKRKHKQKTTNKQQENQKAYTRRQEQETCERKAQKDTEGNGQDVDRII